ncbi:MAG TPA: FkbM family methyltransferase [Gemmatimonadaceae bacterium]|nr:FkbM family methyltransferase [Gemmatimonadaceae bacterium]
MKVLSSLQFILSHPLNSVSIVSKAGALQRYVGWQLGSRLFGIRRVIPFVNDSKLVILKGRPSSTGNLYTRLYEFAEMGFVLHALRPGETFVDVGANIGAYSILAASLGDVTCIAFEPASDTFSLLLENIELNSYSDRIEAKRNAVGAESGEVFLTSALDSVNHIASDADGDAQREAVPLTTLDSALAGRRPAVIKIDVEGYEAPVIEGATDTLAAPECLAVIVEMNGSGMRYGLDEDLLDATLRGKGFEPFSYDPLRRELVSVDAAGPPYNRIYIRDRSEIQQRLKSAKSFRLSGGWTI